jgi:hypothetical protein
MMPGYDQDDWIVQNEILYQANMLDESRWQSYLLILVNITSHELLNSV